MKKLLVQLQLQQEYLNKVHPDAVLLFSNFEKKRITNLYDENGKKLAAFVTTEDFTILAETFSTCETVEAVNAAAQKPANSTR